MTPEERHVLVGDLGWLEYAIADYIAKWGEHWTGRPYLGEFGPNLAGLPTAVANMAMTVIRKNLDPLCVIEPPEKAACCECICQHKHLDSINQNPYATSDRLVIAPNDPHCPIQAHADWAKREGRR